MGLWTGRPDATHCTFPSSPAAASTYSQPLPAPQTTFELVNTYILPPWMLKARAPPPPPKPLCPITGMAARHVDPASRTPYANALAFRRLRTGEGPLPPALQQQLAMDEQLERHARESSRSSARERASGELSRSLGLNRAVGRVQLQELQQQGATGGHGAAGGLGGQLAAQRQRAAQLEAHVAGLVEAARVDPGYNFNQLVRACIGGHGRERVGVGGW